MSFLSNIVITYFDLTATSTEVFPADTYRRTITLFNYATDDATMTISGVDYAVPPGPFVFPESNGRFYKIEAVEAGTDGRLLFYAFE